MISDAYKALLAQMHVDDPKWGSENGARYVEKIAKLGLLKPGMSILDYGCGKGSAGRTLAKMDRTARVAFYDPGIPEWSAVPTGTFDLVVCLDVLEHIEPEHIDAVIAHLKALSRGVLYLCIFMRKARQILPNGKNAHLIVEPPSWWFAKLAEHGITAANVKVVSFKMFGEFRCELPS